MHRSLGARAGSYSTVKFILIVAVCPPPVAVTVNLLVPAGVSVLILLPLLQAVVPMPTDSSRSNSHRGDRLRFLNNPPTAISPGSAKAYSA